MITIVDTLEQHLKNKIGTPVSREELWRTGWGVKCRRGRSLDVLIGRLRAELGARFDILSVTGKTFRGYMLIETGKP